ncbi:MAG: RHS repeat-associated core domain-containing protein [Planctomycetia bacterium]|nr:RHS repeat-associated core domain-containing protein [Planctomycetia bacterium]
MAKAQRVWLMFGESWEADGPDEGDCVDGYTITWAREFRYDATRARYLNRELDPEALEEGDLVALSEVWTDYDGDSSYGDFELDGNPPEPADLRSYEPGVALKDPWDESSGIEYYHSDLIGTTRAMTDYTGASASTVCYTAFGEKLESDFHRYGYAGSWGYQTHDFPDGAPVQYLHVGWRYYDPSTGRFLQRDPMGIGGGANVYAYVLNRPSSTVDPLGLQIMVNGEVIPDPNSPGDIKAKRREYYRMRMRQLGWRSWSCADTFKPWKVFDFIRHTLQVHEEAMGFYPDPSTANENNGRSSVIIIYPPIRDQDLQDSDDLRCNRCFPRGGYRPVPVR